MAFRKRVEQDGCLLRQRRIDVLVAKTNAWRVKSRLDFSTVAFLKPGSSNGVEQRSIFGKLRCSLVIEVLGRLMS